MNKNSNSPLFQQNATCSCQASRISITAKPFARFRCHCSICQKVYKKPFADFVVVNAKHVELNDIEHLEFAKYRLPPALKRGICRGCHSPLLGLLRLAPFVQLAFVPTERFDDSSELPELEGHIFYHRRVQDADDHLPKISGYWKSELAVTKAVLKGLV